MKILLLTPRLPYPPTRGDTIRSFAWLKSLSKEHDVWLATLLEPGDDAGRIGMLRSMCRDVAAVPVSPRRRLVRAGLRLLSGGTFTRGYFESPELSGVLADWGQRVGFDSVLAFSGGMAPLALSVPAGRHVLDLVDADSAKWCDYSAKSPWPISRIYAGESRRLRACEHRWMGQFDETILINTREAAVLGQPEGIAGPTVIPNGVALPDNIRSSATTAPVVAFVGMMSYRPNVDAVCWFADQVWPAVRRVVSDARFVVVGRQPVRAVQRLDGVDGISVVGAVPEVGTYLSNVRACVAPLRIARGLQNKVLESLAWSRPVVATPQAAEGIEPAPTPGVVLAETADQMVDCVLNVLHNARGAERLGAQGRAFVEKHYRWDDVQARLNAAVTGVVCESPSVSPSNSATEPELVAV